MEDQEVASPAMTGSVQFPGVERHCHLPVESGDEKAGSDHHVPVFT